MTASTTILDCQTGLLLRSEIAAKLEHRLEQLLVLISNPLDDETARRAASVRLELRQLADELGADESFLKDRGETTKLEGWTAASGRYIYFVMGAQTFLKHFEDMEHGIYHWGLSNWLHNQRYRSKFQSAGRDLRVFIAVARAILTQRPYDVCRKEIEQEKLERELANWEEQSRLVELVVARLRQACELQFTSAMKAIQDLGESSRPKVKRPTVRERMMAKLGTDATAVLSWSASDWAQYLDCAEGTVKGTDAWERIMQMREMLRVEKAERGR